MKQPILLTNEDEDDQDISITAARNISNQINCSTLFVASQALNKCRTNQIRPGLVSPDLQMTVMHGNNFFPQEE